MSEGDDNAALTRELLAEIRAQRAEATAMREELRALRAGPVASGITVRGLFERFRRAYEHRACWRVARNRLLAFVAAFGDDPCSSITPPRWAAHRDARKQKVAALTVNFELDWAKRMFRWAMEPEQGLVAVNPLALAKREKTRSARETWITEADVQAAMAAGLPKNDEARMLAKVFFLNLVDTGLRFNELRRLRRDRTRQRSDGTVLGDVGRTKNGKTHMVAFTGRGWSALEQIVETIGCPFYFANRRRRALYCERQMRRWLRELFESAGLDARVADGDVRLRAHDLRHSAASAADRRGASLRAIQQMLNHSSMAITERYVHRDEEGAVALARLMEDGATDERAAERKRRGPRRIDLAAVCDATTSTPKSTRG